MGRLNQDQGQLFYSFCLADAVPDDHPIRGIAAVLDLKWVYAELASHYPRLGRPSVDPVLMLRMLSLCRVPVKPWAACAVFPALPPCPPLRTTPDPSI